MRQFNDFLRKFGEDCFRIWIDSIAGPLELTQVFIFHIKNTLPSMIKEIKRKLMYR